MIIPDDSLNKVVRVLRTEDALSVLLFVFCILIAGCFFPGGRLLRSFEREPQKIATLLRKSIVPAKGFFVVAFLRR